MKRWSFLLLTVSIVLAGAIAIISCGNDDEEDEDDGDDDDSDGRVWTDSSSGLMWQADPTGEVFNWYDAADHCIGLSLGGYDDWRLPTISELRSLIRDCSDTQTDGSCGVTDGCVDSECWEDSCNGCPQGEGPADGCYWPAQLSGACGWYWSYSAVADPGFTAWLVFFYGGQVHNGHKYYGQYAVRCVR